MNIVFLFKYLKSI